MDNCKIILISVAVIVALGVIVYFNSLGGEFMFDDALLITGNSYVKNWCNILNLFTKDLGAGFGHQTSFYRPIQMLTYMADYTVWKLNAFGYHLANMLLHILAALSIYWFINILYGDNKLSFLASALFIVHPVHTEAISYISGRADSLAFIFMILAFILYIKWQKTEKTLFAVLAAAVYVIALLSRESALILPALLLLYHYAFKIKIRWEPFLAIAVTAFLYIMPLRLVILKHLLSHISYDTTFWARLPGFFVAITNYIRLLILPFGLHMEYGKTLFSFLNPKAIAGLVIALSSLVYAFRNREKNNIAFFSISWFFITLVPVSNLYPINAYMAEHWLYIPSAGFFLLLAKGLSLLYERKGFKAPAIIIIAAIIAFWSILTIKQNIYWRKPLEFFERTLKYAPNSARVINNMGIAYKAAGRMEDAISSYKKAISLKNDFADAYNNLGNAYRDEGKIEEAAQAYKRALKAEPSYLAHYNLGLAYYDMGKKEDAIELYKKALAIKPDFAEGYNNLGNAYKETGRPEEAVATFKKAIDLNPAFEKAYYNLGVTYKAMGRTTDAIAAYEKAIGLKSDYAEAYNNLGNAYSDMGKNERAIELYKKAIKLKSDYAEAYNNLGSIYKNLKKYDDAIISYKKSIEIKPGHAAYYNLGILYTEMGKKDDAIAAYRKAIELKGDYAHSYNNLGNIYNASGQKEEAVALYKKAIEIKRDFVEAYNNLGNAYKDMGKKEEAVAAYKKALDFGSHYAIHYNLGIIYKDMGKTEDAIKAYSKTIELNPRFGPAYRNLAIIYFDEKKYDIAVEFYDRAVASGCKADPAFLEKLKPHRKTVTSNQ